MTTATETRSRECLCEEMRHTTLGSVSWDANCPSKTAWRLILANLEEPGEDVELKDGDVVVAGEVDGGLERHGLQARADRMDLFFEAGVWNSPPKKQGFF